MAKYFFDIETQGCVERDDDGLELSSLASAKTEAVKALKSIADDLGADAVGWTIVSTVRDGTERVVFEASLELACAHVKC